MSDSMRKRIAVLLGQPEEFSHEIFLRGFLDEAFGLDYDVCVFAMYIKYQSTPARSIGDSSIFKLINYGQFDCVVVMADTIQTKGEAERIEKELHETYKGKVLFVDQDSEYFPSIHIDNYTPEKMVITHLIEKHGFRDIAFLTGKSWHPHSKIRLNAYRDALIEHGIDPDDNNIFYGDFWYTSGESLAESFAMRKKLPEAVACANDCMALGFCKAITAKGYRVPEDVAVVGCDSNEEGQHSPIPLTSSPISSEQLGRNSALLAHSFITDTKPVKRASESKLFVGGTCGCNCDSARPFYFTRSAWDTDLSVGAIFSPFNHMDDDLIGQTTFTGLISTIFGYMHLIRGFDSFNLCLNPSLGAQEQIYEDQLMQVIHCGAEGDNNDRIMTDTQYDRLLMLPEIYEQRQKPSVFYFMPLFFEENVFGFTSVRFDGRVEVPTKEYRAWFQSVCRGIECFRRSDILIGSSTIARKGITTDSLTGLPNYKGFIEQTENFLHLMRNNGGHIGVLAVDIKDLSKINDKCGRQEGDKAIVEVASALENVFSSRNCMCFSVGNAELVALRITSNPGEREILEEKDKLMIRLKEIRSEIKAPYELELYYGCEIGSPQTSEELERIVNIAISRKNTNKSNAQKLSHEESLTEEEQRDARIVRSVLDDNRITYHFQPIVETKTGSIFAYEALMRPRTNPYLPPPIILRYAEFYGRLYDVEKLTFGNIIKAMRKNEAILADGRKIFINSIPGCMLKEEELGELDEYVKDHPDSIVIELTEHSEITDEDLKTMKDTYARIGIDTAVDDYGTGYSNVSNLLRYTPDYVKIDRALLSGIEDSPQKQHFVREIIEFSHDNGIMALAEGVETREELKTVILLGADLIQGYYTARPAAEMVQSISSLVVDEIRMYHSLRELARV